MEDHVLIDLVWIDAIYKVASSWGAQVFYTLAWVVVMWKRSPILIFYSAQVGSSAIIPVHVAPGLQDFEIAKLLGLKVCLFACLFVLERGNKYLGGSTNLALKSIW